MSVLKWDVDKDTGDAITLSTKKHVGITLAYVGLATAGAIGVGCCQDVKCVTKIENENVCPRTSDTLLLSLL